MDREIMRAYYRAMYPEDLPLDRARENAEYVKAEAEYREAYEEFIERLGGVESPLVTLYEDMMGVYAWYHTCMCEEIYLQGAEDRERMLR